MAMYLLMDVEMQLELPAELFLLALATTKLMV